MAVLRWGRYEALAADPAAIDELDQATVLAVTDLEPEDRVDWFARAPVVVIAAGGDIDPGEADIAAVASAVAANPDAARTLVEVVRTVARMGVGPGLRVESLAYSMLLTGPEHRRWLEAQPPRAPKTLGPPLRVERHDRTLVITITRPENRNAFGSTVRDALIEALWLAELDPDVAAVEICGEGPTFSSGGDLAEFGTFGNAARAHQIRTLRSVGAAIDRLADRVTVRVHGPCVGAGVELPAFASRVVASPDTTFRLPEVAMGLIPGAGGTVSLSHRIGPQRTVRLALLGDAIDAETALDWGLIDEISAS